MKKAIKPKQRRRYVDLSNLSECFVVHDGAITYRCETVSEGMAFLAGRREGTLYSKLVKAAERSGA